MDYHQKPYWDRQYDRGNFGAAYEWLASGSASGAGSGSRGAAVDQRDGVTGLRGVLQSLLLPRDLRILHVGAGNSLLGFDVLEDATATATATAQARSGTRSSG